MASVAGAPADLALRKAGSNTNAPTLQIARLLFLRVNPAGCACQFAPRRQGVGGSGKHRRCVNVAGRGSVEVVERLRRLVDKVRVGTAERVELAAGGLGEVKEPVELVPRTDRVEVAAQAQLLVSQRRILRFLADAGLVGQHPPFRRIVTVPAFSDLAVQCIDLLNSC